MKRMEFILFSIVIAGFMLFSGCSTSYQASGLNGGYSEIKKTPDSFIVVFKGNRFTPYEKVMEYALKRAAELTLKNGYKYFSVISSTDRTESYSYSNASKTKLLGNVVKPKLIMEIQCFYEQTASNIIDAEYFLQNN